MHFSALVACIVLITIVTTAEAIDNKHLQCLVCKAMVKELENELSKIDPNRKMEIGNYRLDAEGNELRKKIPMARSEVHLSSVMDEICGKLDDYVRATYKSSGKLTLFNLIVPGGGMNPLMSKVNIIQDGDLNKSLKYLCEEIVTEHEEPIIDRFLNDRGEIIDEICTKATEICNESMPSDEEDEEDNEDDETTEAEELAEKDEL